MHSSQSHQSKLTIDLYDAVMEALWRYDPVRDELGMLRVRVEPEAKVLIAGNVLTSLIREGVLETVQNVPGVQSIEDLLISDLELEIQAAQALTLDPGTQEISPGSIVVRSHLGAVKLTGIPAEAGLDQAVIEVVAQVKGVRSVEAL